MLRRTLVRFAMNWSGIPQIGPDEARALATADKVRILDVREAEEWAEEKLPDRNVLYVQMGKIQEAAGHADPAAKLEELGIGRSLGTSEEEACLVLCRRGVRSQTIAEVLKGVGRTHVANITGGILAAEL